MYFIYTTFYRFFSGKISEEKIERAIGDGRIQLLGVLVGKFVSDA
jgi:hypothetical protein